MKKIIVTGGLGYIGSHTTVELHNHGYIPVIIDNLSNSHIGILHQLNDITGKRLPFYQADITEKETLDEIIKKEGQINGVIHFAAYKSVNESIKLPVKYYQNNLMGLLSVLQVIKNHQIPNFVFSSSCTVYGDTEKLPVTEDTPMGFTPSPYGATKQMSERMIDDFVFANPDIKSISLRYFNPVGAHSSGKIGELPIGIPANLMPYITQTAMGIRPKLYVFGNDYNTPDGTAIRDYIHVTDLAIAHIKALEYAQNQPHANNTKINIGTGKGYSVLDVIHNFEKTTGQKIPFEMAPRRAGDVEAIYADNHLARTLLKWTPKHSLSEMTKSAWAWEVNYRKNKKYFN